MIGDDVRPIAAVDALLRARTMLNAVLTQRDMDWRDREHLLEEAAYRMLIAMDQITSAGGMLADMSDDLFYGDGTPADEVQMILRLLTGVID